MHKITYESLDSTNNYLKSNLESHQHFDVVIAETQSHGRGRRDHTWFSTKDSLTFSILIKNISEYTKTLLPYYTAYIIHKCLDSTSDHLKIKWPNDLLYNGLKLSGILVESIYQKTLKAVVVGIGLNVNQNHFPLELASIATSLRMQENKVFDKEVILNQILNRFEEEYQTFMQNPAKIIDYCNKHLAFMDQEVTVSTQREVIKGTIIGINDQGYLVLKDNQNMTQIISGEILV
jgi:BirA family biotin operon repressor/biotin-[acetyl-CoA-carboxylase] ligase